MIEKNFHFVFYPQIFLSKNIINLTYDFTIRVTVSFSARDAKNRWSDSSDSCKDLQSKCWGLCLKIWRTRRFFKIFKWNENFFENWSKFTIGFFLFHFWMNNYFKVWMMNFSIFHAYESKKSPNEYTRVQQSLLLLKYIRKWVAHFLQRVQTQLFTRRRLFK